jgi:serine protease Do
MNRAIRTSLCFAVGLTAASCSFAQDVTPRARTAANRSIVIGKSGNSYLGIGVAEIDAERAKALSLKEVRGVEVKSVDHDSPAAKAGLKESDVVLEYNGQRIEGTEQFIRLVRETPADRQVNLMVWRNGGTQTLSATIGHRAEHFLLRTDDGGDSALTLEIPPIPPMPPMPAMPPMPERGMMSDVLRGYEVRSGMLGIECEPLGSQLAAFFGVKEGVLVRSVSKDSAAEKAGLRAGDVVVKVDGEAVSSTREITSLVRAARSKHTFQLVVVRDKKEVTLSVTLESATSR